MKYPLKKLDSKIPVVLALSQPLMKLDEARERDKDIICYPSPIHQNRQKIKFGGFYKSITRIIQ